MVSKLFKLQNIMIVSFLFLNLCQAKVKTLEGKFGTYKYDPTIIIGSGSTGTVFKGIVVGGDDKEKVAIKKVKPEDLLNEINMLKVLNENGGHANIIGFLDFINISEPNYPWFWSTTEYTYIVTQHCSQGDLFNWRININEMEDSNKQSDYQKHENEVKVKKLLVGIYKAVNYMHNTKDVIHGDLKLNNIVLEYVDGNPQPFIIDFDYSYFQDKQNYSLKKTGKWNPPEVLNEVYNGKAADMWSIGMISYILLTGKSFPKKGGYADFKKNSWDDISPDAQNLIEQMLKKEPTDRITIKNVFLHDWLKDTDISKSDFSEKNNHTPKILTYHTKEENKLN